MATIIDFGVDDSGINKILDAAERAEKVEKARAKSRSTSKKLTEDEAKIASKQIIALRKEYAERKKNIANLQRIQKRAQKERELADKKAQTLEKKRQAASVSSFNKTKKLLKGDFGAQFAKMGSGGAFLSAGLTIGAAAIASLAAAGGLIAKLAIDAGRARDNAKGMISVMSGGDTKSLEMVDKLAGNLGLSVSKAREQFIDFRKRGLSNKEAIALIKTYADIRTAQGELTADAATDAVFADMGRGFKFGAALDTVQKQTDVAGDGALAAASKFENIESVFDRLANLKLTVFEKLSESITPGFTESLNGIITKFEDFVNSEEADKFITGLNKSLGEMAERFDRVYGYLSPLVDLFGTLLDVIWPLFSTIAEVQSFVLENILATFGAIAESINDVIKIFKEAVPDWTASGEDIIKGLGEGVKKAAKAVWKNITNLADGIKDRFKGLLGISSPSKVFLKYGLQIDEGLHKGISKGIPNVTRAAENLGAAPTEAFEPTINMPDRPSGDINFSIQSLTVNGGGSAEENAVSIRREIELMLQALMIQRGLA